MKPSKKVTLTRWSLIKRDFRESEVIGTITLEWEESIFFRVFLIAFFSFSTQSLMLWRYFTIIWSIKKNNYTHKIRLVNLIMMMRLINLKQDSTFLFLLFSELLPWRVTCSLKLGKFLCTPIHRLIGWGGHQDHSTHLTK